MTVDTLQESGLIAPLVVPSPRPQRQLTFLEFLTLSSGPWMALPSTARERAWICAILLLILLVGSCLSIYVGVISTPGICVFLVGGAYWNWKNGAIHHLKSVVRKVEYIYGPQSRFVAAALYKLGYCYELLGQADEALECYKRIAEFPCCRINAGGAPFQRKVGDLLYSSRHYEEALEAFKKTLELRELHSAPFVNHLIRDLQRIGLCQLQLGNLDGALEVLERARVLLKDRGLQESMDMVNILVQLSSVCERLGNHNEAREMLQEALRISLLNDGEFPRRLSIARIYERLGSLLASQGDSIGAAEQYELAVDVYSRAGKSDDCPEITCLRQKMSDAMV